jgi:tRNA threonylcarbamoyladenosine biosynthesis protein TsaB
MIDANDLFLCIETATATARVAVLSGGGEVRFTAEATADRHSAHVLPLCARALEAVNARPADLAGIACGGGPGSFTGLRVGMSVSKGLALPYGTPFFVVSSLEAMALDIFGASTESEVSAVPCLDAGKGEVYVAGYARDPVRLVREAIPSARLAPAALTDWLATVDAACAAGNGADRYAAAIPEAAYLRLAGPTAISVGRLALGQRARGEAADLASAVPFYGRPPDITLKKPPAG